MTATYDHAGGKLIVVGGGEHGRVVIEAALARGLDVIGFTDPQPCQETTSRFGVKRLGDDRALAQHLDAALILGVGQIGVGTLRAQIVERIGAATERWIALIHPAAVVSSTAAVERGAVVLAGAVVCTGAHIGAHVVVNTGATVDHDVRIGRFAQIGPRAALGGGVVIEEGCYVGMGALVRDHVSVGANSLVAMGAVVTEKCPAGSRLLGVPARSRV